MSREIVSVRAREVYDSRGKPTVEAEVCLAGGARGAAMVPSGASTGRHEAVELRDGGPRLRGQGVRRAVAAVHEVLAAAVGGLAADGQAAVDAALIAADGTADRGRCGSNALLSVSLATARAAAAAARLPLWRYMADLAGAAPCLPLPMVNVLSGGAHAGGGVDVQDFLFVPVAATGMAEAVEQAVGVRLAAGDLLARRGLSTLLADEGGFGPSLRSNEEGLALVEAAIAGSGLRPGEGGAIAVDVAASQWWDGRSYRLSAEDRALDAGGVVAWVAGWADRYPLVSLEDPLAEDDWDGWRDLTQRLGARLQLVGDDLFVTQRDRLRRGIGAGAANAVLVKCNQVGTLTETLDVVASARAAGYRVVVSARSGETEDAWLADLAVGVGAGQIKVGATRTSERMSKYNRLLRIAERCPELAYAGGAAIRGGRAEGGTTPTVRTAEGPERPAPQPAEGSGEPWHSP